MVIYTAEISSVTITSSVATLAATNSNTDTVSKLLPTSNELRSALISNSTQREEGKEFAFDGSLVRISPPAVIDVPYTSIAPLAFPAVIDMPYISITMKTLLVLPPTSPDEYLDNPPGDQLRSKTCVLGAHAQEKNGKELCSPQRNFSTFITITTLLNGCVHSTHPFQRTIRKELCPSQHNFSNCITITSQLVLATNITVPSGMDIATRNVHIYRHVHGMCSTPSTLDVPTITKTTPYALCAF